MPLPIDQALLWVLTVALTIAYKKETRAVARVSMWCYFELANGSTAISELG
jgi:hypothetical protein